MVVHARGATRRAYSLQIPALDPSCDNGSRPATTFPLDTLVTFPGALTAPPDFREVLLRSQKLSARGGALHGGLLVGEGLSQVQALLLLDVFSMSVASETACGVMTKLIELNTTVSTKKGSVVCDAR